MNTTVTLSLPDEQLLLLEQIKALVEKQISFHVAGSWLTESEAAARLKVRECYVRTWRLDGWLRYHQVGEEIRFKTDELDQDFQAQAELLRAQRESEEKAAQSESLLAQARKAGNLFRIESDNKKTKPGAILDARSRARARSAGG